VVCLNLLRSLNNSILSGDAGGVSKGVVSLSLLRSLYNSSLSGDVGGVSKRSLNNSGDVGVVCFWTCGRLPIIFRCCSAGVLFTCGGFDLFPNRLTLAIASFNAVVSSSDSYNSVCRSSCMGRGTIPCNVSCSSSDSSGSGG
jgi:hypothetical protein